MRFFPILTALAVGAFIYMFVMERESLFALAGAERAQAADAAAPAQAAPQQAEVPAGERKVSVRVRKSTAGPVDSGVVLRGRTEATRRVELRAQTSGLVISAPLLRGAQVAAGDVLCRLDPGTRDIALAEAEARLEEARINNRAAEGLTERGFAPETRLAATRAALQSAEAAVERARREIQYLEVRASFDGVLETNTAELGALMQPGGLCATVIALDPIRFVGFVPEAEINRLEEGAMALGRLLDGREFVGQVSYLSRSADPATRTYRLEVKVPNPELAIRDGATSELLIRANSETAHLLPQSALTLDDGGRLGVRVVENGRAQFKPVRVLRDTARGVWLADLPDEADVIVMGQELVADGTEVRISYEEPGQ